MSTIEDPGDQQAVATKTTTNTSPTWSVPYSRNMNFTGRERYLKEVHAALNSGDPLARTVSIYGLGGIGKTQLAMEYAYRHAGEYAIVWWVRAEDPTTLIDDFMKLGQHLDAGNRTDVAPEVICDAIRRALDRRSDWLLVFDNAPGPYAVSHVLPQGCAGHVIITSRNPNWRGRAKACQLHPWERDESASFLHRRTGISGQDDQALMLAAALGDLPLAMEQAAACIEQTNLTFADYLERFKTHREQLLRVSQPVSDYPDTVATTWEIAFEKIKGASRTAGDLLNLCAFLSPDELRRDMLTSGSHIIPYPLAATVADPVKFDGAVAALLLYSLVDASAQTLSIHRLVAAVTRDRMPVEERKRWSEVALKLVNDAFAFESIDIGTWSQCSKLLPHVTCVTNHAENLKVAPQINFSLLNEAARFLMRSGHFQEAKEFLDRALAIAREVFGDKHPNVSGIVNDLGRVHKRLGNLGEARQFFEWALGIDEPIFGQNHPHVATIVNNYGMCVMSDGDFETARQHFEWALSVYESHHGESHPKTASILSNLGVALQRLRRLDEARTHFERALAIAQRTLGPSHPNVASILHNLGESHYAMQDVNGARSYFQQALSIDAAAYGPTHPDVIRDVNSLGQVLVHAGQVDDARRLYRQSLETVEKLHDPNHPRARALRKMLDDLATVTPKPPVEPERTIALAD